MGAKRTNFLQMGEKVKVKGVQIVLLEPTSAAEGNFFKLKRKSMLRRGGKGFDMNGVHVLQRANLRLAVCDKKSEVHVSITVSSAIFAINTARFSPGG